MTTLQVNHVTTMLPGRMVATMTIVVLIILIITPDFVLAEKGQDKTGPWKREGLLSYLRDYANPD